MGRLECGQGRKRAMSRLNYRSCEDDEDNVGLMVEEDKRKVVQLRSSFASRVL